MDAISTLAGLAMCLAACLAASLVAAYAYVTAVVYKHFEKKGEAFDPPTFPFGSFASVAAFRKSFPMALADMHVRHKHAKVVGFFAFWMKSVLLTEREAMRHVLVKDFDKFDDRGMYHDKKRDPLSAHLFSLDGPDWRSLRARLSPTFSSGKIKGMFSNVLECAEEMNAYADKKLGGGVVDVKALMVKFSCAVISTTAFGLASDAFTDEDSTFVRMAQVVFMTTIARVMKMTLLFNAAIARALRLRFVPAHVSDFFRSTVHRTIEMRKAQDIQRNDYMQLLIQLKDASDGEFRLTEDEVAAEAYMFILAGFETTSSTICFCLHELANDAEVQERAAREVDEAGDLTYESVSGMTYLDMVVDETLRKYPPVPFLVRRCKEEYLIPGTNSTIDEGTLVFVSNLALQNDPDLFPEPERFVPERFSKENKNNIKPYSYLPFGDGPRYCIGARFGKLVAKTGVASLLRKFEVRPVTPGARLEFDPRSVTLAALGGVHLRLVPRQKK